MTDALNIQVSNDSFRGADDGRKRRKRLKCADRGVLGMRLGRFPFASAIKTHMERRRGILNDLTWREEERKLRYLGNVFEGLKSQGLISTTDPRHIGRREVQELLYYFRKKGLDVSTQDTHLKYLKAILKTFKNHVIEDMESEGVRFPKPIKKPIFALSVEELTKMFVSVKEMDRWEGSLARGIIALHFATGVRPGELRMAHFEDLNLEEGTFYVRFPKGLGRWASPEKIPLIRGDVAHLLRQYVKEREVYLKARGIDKATALFPSIRSKTGFYSRQRFQDIKEDIEGRSGVKFKLKDFRSTLASITVAGDLSRLPAVSAQLRHLDPKTTTDFYARIELNTVTRQLRDVWKENPTTMYNTPVIERKYDISGYQ